MPTLFKIKWYRIFFFSNEHLPIHVHIENGEKQVKYSLQEQIFKNNYRFSNVELTKIKDIISSREEEIVIKWNKYFNNN